MPADIKIFSGLRTTAKITLLQESLKINKTSVIKDGDTQIVFVKNKEGYTSVPVEILAEDDTSLFCQTFCYT